MSGPLRSADIMADKILSSTALVSELQTTPETVLRKMAAEVTRDLPPPAVLTDVWTYRFVVIALGLVCIAAIGGAIYLSARASGPINVPDTLTALGATAIGALAGLLAPSPTRK